MNIAHNKDAGAAVPPWCAFFSAGQYTRFRDLVERVLREHDADVATIDTGTVALTERRGDAHLETLARLCHGSDPSTWSDHVRVHFLAAYESLAERAELRRAGWSTARERVKPRLHGVANLPEGEYPRWQICSGLVAVPVLDLTHSLGSLERADIAEWGVDDAELFDVAVANLRAEPHGEWRAVHLGEQMTALMLTDASLFTASRLLTLGELLPGSAPHGVLVSVPHGHLLAAHVIADLSVLGVIGQLAQISTREYAEDAGAISPSLYWWRAGSTVEIPYQFEDGRLTLAAPASFTALLGQLATPT